MILSYSSPRLFKDEGWQAGKGCRHASAPDYQPTDPQEEESPPSGLGSQRLQAYPCSRIRPPDRRGIHRVQRQDCPTVAGTNMQKRVSLTEYSRALQV